MFEGPLTAASAPPATSMDCHRAVRPADRRRDATRQEILEAAWALCHERGLSALSLRDLAERVGMRAPSLYSYFPSKDAIYDAMFAAGQASLIALLEPVAAREPTREVFREGNRVFFEFCTSDPVRYQLLFQRTIPGFVPSDGSYALAVRVLELLTGTLVSLGVTEPRHVDLWTAVMTGLTDQQLSNDPGGDRWGRLLDEAVDLYCDHVGIPPARRPSRTARRKENPR